MTPTPGFRQYRMVGRRSCIEVEATVMYAVAAVERGAAGWPMMKGWAATRGTDSEGIRLAAAVDAAQPARYGVVDPRPQQPVRRRRPDRRGLRTYPSVVVGRGDIAGDRPPDMDPSFNLAQAHVTADQAVPKVPLLSG